MATYATKQHKAVLACIASHRGECVSANALLDELRRSGASIGLATVYRLADGINIVRVDHIVLGRSHAEVVVGGLGLVYRDYL